MSSSLAFERTKMTKTKHRRSKCQSKKRNSVEQEPQATPYHKSRQQLVPSFKSPQIYSVNSEEKGADEREQVTPTIPTKNNDLPAMDEANGTCRANRGGFLAAVQYGRTEAAKVDLGTHKMVSDANYGIACYGWIDGNLVHFLTSADGTTTNEITKRIGRSKKKVKAPICIKLYNNGKQAVGRHVQL
jgi:hypothetical protein